MAEIEVKKPEDNVDPNARGGPTLDFSELSKKLDSLPDTLRHGMIQALTATNQAAEERKQQTEVQRQAAADRLEMEKQNAAKLNKLVDENGAITQEGLNGLVSTLMSHLTANFDSKLQPVAERVAGLADNFESERTVGRIKSMRGDKENFPYMDDLGREMIAVAGEVPNMSPEDIYHVTVGRNQAKVATLRSARDKAKADAEKQQKTMRGFGGLEPGFVPDGQKPGSMDAKEAAAAAWRQAFKDTPFGSED